jgi:thiol-disulfide isomerase/thioredoxin
MNWSKFNNVLNILLILAVAGYVFRYFYLQPKFDDGDKAIEFGGQLKSGEKFNLSDVRGKYILLDFWGSWCGPCRKENPELVALYHEFKDKTYNTASGFDIVSVALEAKKESWEKAILQDKLNWKYHIGEFEKFSGPIAVQYGIKELPTKYFISPDGLILKVNPKISEIKSYLSDMEEK